MARTATVPTCPQDMRTGWIPAGADVDLSQGSARGDPHDAPRDELIQGQTDAGFCG